MAKQALDPNTGDERDTSIDTARLRLVEQAPYEGLPQSNLDFSAMSVDTLWRLREEVDQSLKDLRDYRGYIDQELARRVRESRPEFDEMSAGSAELVGEDRIVRMTYSRDYEYVEQHILALREHLTQDEFDRAVKFVAKVDRRVLTQLEKRGGVVAELIAAATVLKSARPNFEAKARS